ncbi:RNA-dependent ATPase rok1 [Pyricularia oryzae]
MDILKVLSRGTKQAPKKPGVPATTLAQANIPSAGVETNPQLYHDNVGPPPKGKKRKRKSRTQDHDQADDAVDDDVELSDFDFFAPKTRRDSDGAGSKTKAADVKKAKKDADEADKARPIELDECKRILRSHRLKYTLLPVQKAAPAKVEKSSAKKKKKKDKGDKVDGAAQAAQGKSDKLPVFPQPLVSFSQLRSAYRISPRLADNLAKGSYKVPTEVQLGALPLLLQPEFALSHEGDGGDDDGKGGDGEALAMLQGASAGVDFLAIAPTGSGKTLSFLLPAINGVLKRRAEKGETGGDSSNDTKHALEAIVVAPTRELASQIANEGRKLAMGTGVRVVLMRKGMRVAAEEDSTEKKSEDQEEDVFESEDEDSLSEDDEEREKSEKPSKKPNKAPITKADILVTTPMLLLNFLSKGTSTTKKRLPRVRSLILDEADVLLDQLFREQTMGIWSACRNPNLRVSFWSATMASNIETHILDNLRAQADDAPAPPLIRLVVGLKDTAVPNISHRLVYTATESGKLLALRQLLHPASFSTTTSSTTTPEDETPLRPPFLVFVQTIERATALHEELKYDIPAAAGGASRVAVLHSSMPESARAAVIRRFRAADVWVLITTDVLARGVDFAGVNGVVNYDVPGSASAYVHRAGRTGRAGRKGGIAVTFYTKEDIPFVKNVANVIALSERQAGAGESATQKWLLDALPDVSKKDKKELREKGVESRRSVAASKGKARITSKSAWERRKENNRKGAIEGSKRRKIAARDQGDGSDDGGEWGGIDD